MIQKSPIDDRGVSSVISTVLMVAIAITLVSGLIAFGLGLFDQKDGQKQDKNVLGEVAVTDEGYVLLRHIEGNSIDLKDTNIIVQVNSGGSSYSSTLTKLPLDSDRIESGDYSGDVAFDERSGYVNGEIQEASYTASDTLKFRVESPSLSKGDEITVYLVADGSSDMEKGTVIIKQSVTVRDSVQMSLPGEDTSNHWATAEHDPGKEDVVIGYYTTVSNTDPGSGWTKDSLHHTETETKHHYQWEEDKWPNGYKDYKHHDIHDQDTDYWYHTHYYKHTHYWRHEHTVTYYTCHYGWYEDSYGVLAYGWHCEYHTDTWIHWHSYTEWHSYEHQHSDTDYYHHYYKNYQEEYYTWKKAKYGTVYKDMVPSDTQSLLLLENSEDVKKAKMTVERVDLGSESNKMKLVADGPNGDFVVSFYKQGDNVTIERQGAVVYSKNTTNVTVNFLKDTVTDASGDSEHVQFAFGKDVEDEIGEWDLYIIDSGGDSYAWDVRGKYIFTTDGTKP